MQVLEELELGSAQALRRFITAAFRESPNRRDHILAVADFAKETAIKIASQHPQMECDPDEAERAALLHDIGYLQDIVIFLDKHSEYTPTGWHPIDGANFLRVRGEGRLAELIEGHGNSLEVAKLRNLPLFTPSDDLVAKIVTFCDSQTGPMGERVTYEERLHEIISRKGSETVAAQAHRLAKARTEIILQEIADLLTL